MYQLLKIHVYLLFVKISMDIIEISHLLSLQTGVSSDGTPFNHFAGVCKAITHISGLQLKLCQKLAGVGWLKLNKWIKANKDMSELYQDTDKGLQRVLDVLITLYTNAR